jgi:hypothetical protein
MMQINVNHPIKVYCHHRSMSYEEARANEATSSHA